jgi:hypothetical protein
MSEGPSPGRVLIGSFLLVAGVCLVLLGGGCTIMVLGELGSSRGGDLDLTGLVLTISLLMLAIGGLMVWGGMRLLKPRDE